MDPVDRYFLERDKKIAKLVGRGEVPKIDWTKPLPPEHVDSLYDSGIPPNVFKKSRVYAALKDAWKGRKEKWTAEGCLKEIEEWARAASEEVGVPRQVADALDAILYRLHVLAAIKAGNTVYAGPTAGNPCFEDPLKNIYKKLGHPELWIYYKAAHLNCSAWYIIKYGLKELPTEGREEYIRFSNSDLNPEYIRFTLINQLRAIRGFLGILPDAKRCVLAELLGRIEEGVGEVPK